MGNITRQFDAEVTSPESVFYRMLTTHHTTPSRHIKSPHTCTPYGALSFLTALARTLATGHCLPLSSFA